MDPAGNNLGRFPSRFLLMVIPGVVASGIVASVLYAVQVSRAPSSSELLTDLTPQGDGLSAEERRGLTRQMLKARRENPQAPAEVRPVPTSRPATAGLADSAVEAKAPDQPVSEHPTPDRPQPERAPTAAPLPAARPIVPSARPEAAVAAAPGALATTLGAVAPPATAPAQSAPLPLGPADAALQPSATGTTPAAAEPEAQPRSFAANVFSSLSTLAGTAVNATGNTVNWVIELPGKAISAGGKLLGGDSAASNQPAAPPPPASAPSPATGLPPATAPPPKRNL